MSEFWMPPGRSAARRRALTAATAAVAPLMRRRAGEWLDRTPAGERRVHLGCADRLLEGWLNLDLAGPRRVDLAWDARRPLPFPDGSIDAVFHEHMIAYFTYDEADRLFHETARVLRPGGITRFVAPDFGAYAVSYVGDGRMLEEIKPRRFSRLMAVAEVAYGYGQISLWDGPHAVKMLEAAGLEGRQTQFCETELEPCPDHPGRTDESLYVEGRKPA
jgi:SAM-dependent methyltransferase